MPVNNVTFLSSELHLYCKVKFFVDRIYIMFILVLNSYYVRYSTYFKTVLLYLLYSMYHFLMSPNLF
jgi:hypothetical protein